MPRKKPRTSNKGTYTGEQMKAALLDVIAGKPIRSAAKAHDLNYNTLNRKYRKLNGSNIPDDLPLTANYTHNHVFSPDLEVELASYIRERSELGHGLDTDEVRLLAFDFAVANAIKVPDNWRINKTAGKDWFMAFMKRNQTLSLRTPQAFSASRAACFNKPNIQNYFEKLNTVLDRNPRFASGERIFNADEIRTTTVAAISRKVVGPKRSRQVHQAQSHERGESVTSMFFACANGTFLPPVMLFPRVTYNTGMVKDCYPRTLGIATGKKGYMNHIVMVQSIRHFIEHSNSSKENPSLLIVDNFGSHITLDVINLCKENGVTLFTLPPHTTHRTQPLDVGVFKPFKNAYNKAVHTWNSQNAGKSVSIYEVAGFVHTAILQSFTPQNILSAFRATGIHPFNPNIFPDKDFFKSSVTHQENPAEAGLAQLSNNEKIDEVITLNDIAEIPESPVNSTLSDASTTHVSPHQILPMPKAGPKVASKKPRKKGKCMVATDTPEKLAIEEAEMEKRNKAEDKLKRAALREEKKKEAAKRKAATQTSRGPKTKRSAQRALFPEDSTESEEDDVVSVATSESSDWREEEEEEPLQADSFPPLERSPQTGDFVLVEFPGKEVSYYIGKIKSEENREGEFEISYLRKSEKMRGKFVFPNIEDLSHVHKSDVKLIMPIPTTSGTRRQQNFLGFDIDLSLLKVL